MSTSRMPAVGLVAPHLEPPVSEIDVAPQHRPGRGDPPTTEQQHRERGAPAGRLDRGALLPGAARPVHDLDHDLAAVELAAGLEQDRDLLGAVQVHGPRP